MSFIATAVVGLAGAVVGAGATVYASKQSTKAANSSSKRALAATQSSNALQWEMYSQQREDQEPWRLAGEAALKRLSETPDFSFSSEDYDFFADPSYGFRVNEGVNALDKSAASRGRVLSGAQDKALTAYGQDMASTEYSNAFNRAQSKYLTNQNKDLALAGIGQNATNQTQAAGTNTANAVNSNTIAGANAQNSIAMSNAANQGQAAAGVATSVNNALGSYLLYKNMK